MASISWDAGMTSAPSRTRSSARATAGGITDSSCMESICPSFSAAPRMRHSATASRSALASVKNTLSPASREVWEPERSGSESFKSFDVRVEENSDVDGRVGSSRVSGDDDVRDDTSFVVLPPAPRHARRADSATVPAARPAASCPNPITRASGDEGTATSRRRTFVLLVASRESVSADALVDAGAVLGASSARSTFASVASVVDSATKDAAGADAADSRDADAIGRARRVSWAAFVAAPGAARLATPPVSTISATAFSSLDARGPRVAAALRATPSAPRASCASAEARSDIARGGSRVARADASGARARRHGVSSTSRDKSTRWQIRGSRHFTERNASQRRRWRLSSHSLFNGRALLRALALFFSRKGEETNLSQRAPLLHPHTFVPLASPSYGLSLWHGTPGTSTSCAVLHSALHPNVSASSRSIGGGVLPK